MIFGRLRSSTGISGCVQQRAVVDLVTTWLAAADLKPLAQALLIPFCGSLSEKAVEKEGASRSSLPCTSAMQR